MIVTHARAKESSIRAVITRADGSVEDLGQIAYWHRNPLKRWWWALRQALRPVSKNSKRSGL